MSLDVVLSRDEYDDPRSAGAVNNTPATDGVSTRIVTDTENKISISSGNLVFSGGKSAPSSGDPGIWYPSRERAAGIVYLSKLTLQNTAGIIDVGWDNDTSGNCLVAKAAFRLNTSLLQNARVVTIGSISATSYTLYNILRAVGAVNMIAGGAYTHPTIVWIEDTDSTSSLRHSITNYDASPVFAFSRVAGYWLPVPIVSDGFSTLGTSDGLGHAETSGVGSGGSGVTWTGATWSVSGGKAINTPSLGSELVINGDFSVDANWSKGTGWSISGGTANASAVSGFDITQNILTIGKWYKMTYAATFSSGQSRALFGGIGGAISESTSVLITGRATSSAIGVRGQSAMTGTVDNVSVREISLSSLLSLHTSSTPDVFVGVEITVTADTQAGLALNWDSSSNPQNGVIAYHDGSNCKLEKCVAGTWTTVVSAAATYSANARIVVSKIGTAYRLYYNNALVGSGTISDSGVVNNTKHGLFSTDSSNTLDNYAIYASGTGGEYDSALQIVLSNERTATMSMADSLLKVPVKILSDALSFTDSVLRTIIKSEPVQLTLNSTEAKTVVKVFNDALAFTDSVLRTVIKSETVQMMFDGTENKTIIKTFSDGIAFASSRVINYGKRIIRIIRLKGKNGGD